MENENDRIPNQNNVNPEAIARLARGLGFGGTGQPIGRRLPPIMQRRSLKELIEQQHKLNSMLRDEEQLKLFYCEIAKDYYEKQVKHIREYGYPCDIRITWSLINND